MNKPIWFWQALGFIFTSILGTLLHFAYDFSGGNGVVALFSAVNESIWEHMKLLYLPMLVFAMIGWRFMGKQEEQYWCVKLKGILLGLILIPVLYYTYTGILGVSADWFNVTIFFIAAGAAFCLETKLFAREKACPISSRTAFFLICLIGLIFIIFTFVPPRIPLFQDPITQSYGLQRGA